MELNLWPRVSEPETSPTLRWTGKVGDALVFWFWGVLSLVRDAKANNLSSCTLRRVFLGFPTDAPPWQFYHPRSRRVFSSQDVTFDEVLLPQPVVVDSGAETAGAESRGAEPEGEGSGGAGSRGATTGGAGSWSAASGGPASPSGGGAVGDPAGGPGAGQPLQPDLLETLSPQAIRALIVRQGSPGGGGCGPASVRAASPGGSTGAGGTGGTAGAGGTGGTAGAGGAASAGGTRGAAGAGGARATSPRGATGAASAGPTSPGGAGAAGPGGARSGGARAAGPGGAVRAGGPTGAAGSGGTRGAAGSGAARVGGTAGAGGAGGASGAAGTGGVGGTIGARGPRAAGASGAAGARGAGVATGATGAGGAGAAGAGGAGTTAQYQPQLLPGSLLPVLGPHTEVTESLSESHEPETRASTPVRARRVTRPRPPAVPRTHGMALRPSSIPQRVVLPELPASSLPHFSDPESDFARADSPTVTHLLATVVTRSRLDYIASLVTESESVCPPFVGDELALGSEVLDDRQFELECLAATLPRFASMLLCPEGDPDALDIPTPRSYAEAIAAQRDYKLHSLDFSTAFLQGSLHEEIWLRRPPGFTGSFPAGT
ncbi:unnamed protein product [Closterium sp. NIES-54]